MSRKTFWVFFIAAFVIAAMATSDVYAQGRGGRGRGFGGRGFGGPGTFNVMGLLGVEEVRKEIELTEEQQKEIQKVAEANRRPRGERRNFQDMSEEEREQFRAEMRERAEQRAKEAKETLATILVPPQIERLDQIAVQIQGVNALVNAEVAKKVGLSDEQVKTIQTELEKATNDMREKMRAMFTGGDREGMREKIQALRKDLNEQTLAKLTDEQRQKFEELRGKPFDMPADMFRRGRRGGPDGGGRRGGNRPQRPGGEET